MDWKLNVPPYLAKELAKQREYLTERIGDNEAIKMGTLNILPYFATLLTSEQLENLGHQLRDMIKSCYIGKTKCKDSDFDPKLDSAYGNCFTYNDKLPPMFNISRSGVEFGLSVELNVEQPEYLSVTDQSGIVVIIHDQNETIIPENMKHVVAPGAVTSIGLTMSKVFRQTKPFSDCVDNGIELDNYYTTKYSQVGCQKSCLQRGLIVKCNCGDPRLPIIVGQEHCGPRQIDCVSEFYANSSNASPCNCPEACSTYSFNTVSSFRKWPRLQDSDQKDPTIHKATVSNTLKLEIYFTSIQIANYLEHPTTSVVEVVSGIGGTIGLFVGMSVISYVEFIKYLCEILIIRMRKIIKKY